MLKKYVHNRSLPKKSIVDRFILDEALGLCNNNNK